MKKVVLIFLLLLGIDAAAQIRLSNFSQSFTDGAASDVRTAQEAPDGQLCAVLKLETKVSGWTFDAGLTGITDTRYEDGSIWIYIPASARFLTVAHKDYGTLREWPFPVALEPGRTYTAKLSYERQKESPKRPSASPSAMSFRPIGGKSSVPSVTFSRQVGEKAFCQHFMDFYVGAVCSPGNGEAYELDGDTWFGFNYTWVGERVGPYISVGSNFEGDWEVIGGAAYRLTNPDTASLDWQVYGGIGFTDGSLGFDVGTRFGWRSSYQLSHWDFGFGCQYFHRSIMPTVSVGLYIWGIPTVICLGVIAGGI